jgi:uncharacterized protein YkwD
MFNLHFIWKHFILLFAVTALIVVSTACSTAPVANTPTVQTSLPFTSSTQPPAFVTPTDTAVQSPAPPVSTSEMPSPTLEIPTPSPSPSTTIEPLPPTSPIYTPDAAAMTPAETDVELFQYMLDLINKDRQAAGLNPVALNYNSAAQEHAQDMLDHNYQAAHWGTDGYKPYMRYTVAGGLSFEKENSAYSSSTNTIDPKTELKLLQWAMMNDDAASNWSHKETMLYKWNKMVNLGIAYNNHTLTLVQQFEGDYIEYSQPPALNGSTLSLTGHFTQPGFTLNNISIAYDERPQPLTTDQLNQPQYHHYELGDRVGVILPPPPEGQIYQNLPSDTVIAGKGNFNYDGWFYIEADISRILSSGPGIYTVVLITQNNGEPVNMSNYSLFVN